MNTANSLKIDTPSSDVKLTTSNSLVDNEKATNEFKPDSYLYNVFYGVGMLLFILIPVLVPGITVKFAVIGLFILILGIYVYAGITFAIRSQKSKHQKRRGRTR